MPLKWEENHRFSESEAIDLLDVDDFLLRIFLKPLVFYVRSLPNKVPQRNTWLNDFVFFLQRLFWNSVELKFLEYKGRQRRPHCKIMICDLLAALWMWKLWKMSWFLWNYSEFLCIFITTNRCPFPRMHFIWWETNIRRRHLLWGTFPILYSRELKTRMLQNHLCRKKPKLIFWPPSICCAAELYWGGSSCMTLIIRVFSTQNSIMPVHNYSVI